MRFAPPNPLRIADRASGLNSLSVRSYNERLVLSLLLQNEATTRLEIGEKTGLSAQTISVIVRSLEQEGLVVRGEAQKGRVGPPTTPLMLNSEGAYSVGVSVGHRNTHIVVVDFIGNVQHRHVLPHRVAGAFDALETLPGVINTLEDEIKAINAALTDPNFYQRDPTGFAAKSKALMEAEAKRSAAEEEWLELELLREELEG